MDIISSKKKNINVYYAIELSLFLIIFLIKLLNFNENLSNLGIWQETERGLKV